MRSINSREVISICSSDHVDVWKLTSNLLPKHIAADSYKVIVPDAEIELFREVTPDAFEIASQEATARDYIVSVSAAVKRANNQKRLGWYLQQFHKIEALHRSAHSELVIWDADCVPVSEMELFSPTGEPRYMEAAERHQAYFDTIERLIGPTETAGFSFVIPGFPTLSSWIDEFIDELAEYQGLSSWHDALIAATDFSLKSGFSETETLGTWTINRHPAEWTSFPIRWERLGQSRFGPASGFLATDVERIGQEAGLEIISFENWDTGSRRNRTTAGNPKTRD